MDRFISSENAISADNQQERLKAEKAFLVSSETIRRPPMFSRRRYSPNSMAT